MTTPRDDIAWLSEGLRVYAKHAMPCYPNDICSLSATQLDALLKEREALEARGEELERVERQAEQLTSLRADNDKMHDLVDQLTQAHHDAEAKCDDLAQQLKDLRAVTNYNREQAEAAEARTLRAEARVKELEEECDRWAETSNEQDDVKRDLRARTLRAEQERDEAYELAIQAIRSAPTPDANGYAVTKDAAIKAILSLASGPEKDSPPQEKI